MSDEKYENQDSFDANYKSEGSSIAWVAVREMLSDILGAFMPGVYFTAVLLCYLILFFFMLNGQLNLYILLSSVKPFIPFFVLIFCVFSYCIGSIFYRRDIKNPDKASAAQYYSKASEKEREGLAIDMSGDDKVEFLKYQKKIKWLNHGWLKRLYIWLLERKAIKYLEVEYPYAYLPRYLETRDFSNSAEIPWEKKIDARSKAFINICKVNIHKYLPKEMPEIVKNEAHARLMNSLWYTAKSINFTSVLFFVLAVLCMVFLPQQNNVALTVQTTVEIRINIHFALGLGIMSLVQFILALYFKHSIKQFLHYLRLREIVFVLQLRKMLKIMFKGKPEEELIK